MESKKCRMCLIPYSLSLSERNFEGIYSTIGKTLRTHKSRCNHLPGPLLSK